MNFQALPDIVFLRILEFLPLEDSVRLGRVDKSFRRISQMVMSRVKILDLTQDRFQKIDASQLGVLLKFCNKSLEKVVFPGREKEKYFLVGKFSLYDYPRLTYLDLYYVPIWDDMVCEFIRKCPKIKHLCLCENSRFNPTDFRYPQVTNENLATLKAICYDDGSLESLTNRCPNLTALSLEMEHVTLPVLDQFFASTPQLREIELILRKPQISLEPLNYFWNLNLEYLDIVTLKYTLITDSFIKNIAGNFPNLRVLRLQTSQATNHGISALEKLRNLNSLYLELKDSQEHQHDDGIARLGTWKSNCKSLQTVSLIRSRISYITLATMLGNPHIFEIMIRSVPDLQTAQLATILVLHVGERMRRKRVTLKFNPVGRDEATAILAIWDAQSVKETLKNLKETRGVDMVIEWMIRSN